MNEAKAQFIIATNESAVLSNQSTLMQFQDNDTRGIILPANINAQTSPTNGTFILDQSDKKVKMFENNSWVNLSEEGELSSLITNNSTDNGEGVIVGADSSNAEGVLVLESDDRALVLHRINDLVTNVNSPYPGMIAYDTKSKTIAIFDGKVWNFWK